MRFDTAGRELRQEHQIEKLPTAQWRELLEKEWGFTALELEQAVAHLRESIQKDISVYLVDEEGQCLPCAMGWTGKEYSGYFEEMAYPGTVVRELRRLNGDILTDADTVDELQPVTVQVFTW